jgi:hypothetical protein
MATQVAAISETDSSRFRRCVAARVYALVARDRALLPAEVARDRCAGIATGLLGRDRFGVWHFISLRLRARASSTTWITSIPAR